MDFNYTFDPSSIVLSQATINSINNAVAANFDPLDPSVPKNQGQTPANQITPNTNNTLYWIIGGILLLFLLIYLISKNNGNKNQKSRKRAK